MSEHLDAAAELRRLRAALGATGAALLSSGADPGQLLAAEVELLEAIARRANPGDAAARLLELWRELRAQTTALAADLPADDEAIALLRHAAEADEARLGTGRGERPRASG